MENKGYKFLIFSLSAVLFVAGCATTKPRRAPEPSAEVQSLQAELQAKDQQIQDLQYQLESYEQSSASNFSSSSKTAVIRVPGVTVKALQRALSNAGLDPGPVDGRMGKKTKAAVKEFQRKNNLKADGVVGEKTWSLLK